MKNRPIKKETEIKLRVPGRFLEPLRKKLQVAGFRTTSERSLEIKTLFDYPDHRIREAGSALRLRDYRNRHILTWKGPATSDQGLKIRDEAETEVGNREEALLILRNLGLEPVFEYSKYREKFRLNDGKDPEVCIDETKAGMFIEIEGTRQNIEELIGILGLSSFDSVRETYVELLREEDDPR